jgi:hypothetical protein
MIFIPLIFACGIVAPYPCVNQPERGATSQFQTHSACMEFVLRQAPKVIAALAHLPVMVTVRCVETPSPTCVAHRGLLIEPSAPAPREIALRVAPYLRGGPNCKSAGLAEVPA